MEYHAHIYWWNQRHREIAMQMRAELERIGGQVGAVHDIPIGPHPHAMFQVVYDSQNQQLIEDTINTMRQDLSVLLHESINDDVRDHTLGARWLGKELELDLVWLQKYVDERNARCK